MVNGRTAQRYARVVVSVDKGPMKNRVHLGHDRKGKE